MTELKPNINSFSSESENKKLRQMIELIKYPLVNDKATRLLEQNKYTFLVDNRATKNIIKIAIEFLFDVRVKNVNTLRTPKQTRSIGRFKGYKPNYKKAIVTLDNGYSINLFPDL